MAALNTRKGLQETLDNLDHKDDSQNLGTRITQRT